MVTELPFMIDYALKAVSHSIDAIKHVRAARVFGLESRGLYWSEMQSYQQWTARSMDVMQIVLEDFEKVRPLLMQPSQMKLLMMSSGSRI